MLAPESLRTQTNRRLVVAALLNGVLLTHLLALPSSTQSAIGGVGVGVTSLLLDSEARAGLDPAVLVLLQGALSDAMHVVFIAMLLTTLANVVLATLLPGGRPHEPSSPGEPPDAAVE